MYINNKKVIISDKTLSNNNKPKKVYKQKNSLLSYKIYHVVNVNIEAI